MIGKGSMGFEPGGLLWSADGRTLAVGRPDGLIHLWDMRSGKVRRQLRGHRGRISCLAFSPDGKILASGSEDTTLLVWKIDSDG